MTSSVWGISEVGLDIVGLIDYTVRADDHRAIRVKTMPIGKK
jgi:hypothetical protein